MASSGPYHSIENLGERVLDVVKNTGRFGLFLFTSGLHALVPPYEFAGIVAQIRFIGSRSLLLVAMAGTFATVPSYYALTPRYALFIHADIGPASSALAPYNDMPLDYAALAAAAPGLVDAFVAPTHNVTWLLFGDRNFSSDFLYQIEWLRYRKEGSLQRLDVAFSRDQQQKIYVQDRILEQAKRIHAWLERGATIYVCGDADRMAVDVNQALLTLLRTEGGLTDERAKQQLAELKAAHRYQRDVD